MSSTRTKRTYDHRLVRLVQETGDPSIAMRLGVPRTTAAGWVRRVPASVVTATALEPSNAELRARVARLEARLRRLMALLRVLLDLLRVVQPDLTRRRIPKAEDKARLLREIDRSRDVLGVRVSGVSILPDRLHHRLDPRGRHTLGTRARVASEATPDNRGRPQGSGARCATQRRRLGSAFRGEGRPRRPSTRLVR